MKRALSALLVIWPAIALTQSDVTGAWRAEGQPSMQWTFALSVDGARVVGTATMMGRAL